MKRSDANARAEVSVYMRELPDYRKAASDSRVYAETLDYAVWFRRRTIECVSEDRQLVAGELSLIGGIGRQRARQGFTLNTAQRVLTLHANQMLREIHDAADGQDVQELLHLMAWCGSQGARGTAAYLQAHMDEQHLRLSVATRVRALAQLLLTGDAAAPSLAISLGVDLHDHYLVVVVRMPGQSLCRIGAAQDELIAGVFKEHLVPLSWQRPDELLALVPHDGSVLVSARASPPTASSGDRLPRLVREIVERVGRPCAVGTAAGPAGDLTRTAELARRVAHVAPLETTPRTFSGVADVFAELAATQLPEVDRWLREIARRLATGPDLVTTLDAYYRADMNRLLTAAALNIHPRTLDYRLQRVRALSGLDPSTVHGVRVLSTTITRVLSGAWTHECRDT
ncbi:PucR family transcriptional regulator [Spongiactinospora rosea]|nr:PucR family transcriptional regulator [Spongiactinospora rosea]